MSVFFDYFVWHYRYALPHLFSIFGEFVRFFFNLFSIKLFLLTLLKPLFGVQGSFEKQDVSEVVALFAANIMMRVVGFVLRVVLIVVGLSLIFVTVVVALFASVVWFLLPVLLGFSAYMFFSLL